MTRGHKPLALGPSYVIIRLHSPCEFLSDFYHRIQAKLLLFQISVGLNLKMGNSSRGSEPEMLRTSEAPSFPFSDLSDYIGEYCVILYMYY